MAYSEVREISISNECAPPLFFRSDNEAISSRSDCVFHQLEGLYIDKKVSFAKQMFSAKVKLRFRPSFFPFAASCDQKRYYPS